MRKPERVELARAPFGEMIVVALARGVARLSTRIRAPRAYLGAELDDHPPARAGGSVSSRGTQRARSGLHRDVEPRERRNAQQVIDVLDSGVGPAPRGARWPGLLHHAVVARAQAGAQDH